MNTIVQDQNTPMYLRLLKARQRIYSDAMRLQILQLLVSVVVPVLGAVSAFLWPEVRPYVALYGLIATTFDVMLIDRAQRRLVKVAARVSEQFDCGVLKMQPNVFVAGKPLDAEIVDAAARRWDGEEDKIKGWYKKIDPAAPHAKARLVVQRMNLTYDASLRRAYGKWLIFTAIVTVLGLIVVAVMKDLKMLDIAAVATTISPAIFWAIREQFRQSDAATTNETLKTEAEKVLDTIKADGTDDEECEKRSREFQDAIFQRRVANPLVLPFVYDRMRDELEQQAQAGADALLK